MANTALSVSGMVLVMVGAICAGAPTAAAHEVCKGLVFDYACVWVEANAPTVSGCSGSFCDVSVAYWVRGWGVTGSPGSVWVDIDLTIGGSAAGAGFRDCEWLPPATYCQVGTFSSYETSTWLDRSFSCSSQTVQVSIFAETLVVSPLNHADVNRITHTHTVSSTLDPC